MSKPTRRKGASTRKTRGAAHVSRVPRKIPPTVSAPTVSRSILTPLDQSLQTLENADLLRQVGSPEVEYLFKHVLTQESAYNTLLVRSRHEIHRLVAQSIEALYPDRLDEYATRLAQHYALTGDTSKTLEYLIRSGNQAARVYANAEAIEQYGRALEIAKGDPASPETTRELFIKRGRLFELSGNQENALKNYKELEQLARERNDRASELEAIIRRATIHSAPTAKFDPIVAQDLSNRALELARNLDDRAAEAKILWNLLLLNYFIGETERAVKYGEASLKIARENNLVEQMAFTLNDLANPLLGVGEIERAAQSLLDARDIWRTLDNKPMLSDNLITYSTILYYVGKFDESIAQAEEGYRLSQTINNLWGQSYGLMNKSFPLFELGRWEECIAALETSIETGQMAGFLVAELGGRSLLGVLFAYLGVYDRAIELAERAMVERGGFSGWGATANGALALIYAEKEDWSKAEEYVRSSYADSRFAQNDPFLTAFACFAESEIALAHHDAARARGAADKLIALLNTALTPLFYYDALLIIGLAQSIDGQYGEAHQTLSNARVRAEKIGARRALSEIHAALGRVERLRGNSTASKEYYTSARNSLDDLVAHIPRVYRDSFLNSRRVKKILGEE